MRTLRTTLGLLLGLAAAALVAWRMGGPVGTGALLGYLLGASLAALGALWQRHWLRVRPRRALQAYVEAFLVKLAALLVCALLFSRVEALAERADWRSLILGFAAAVALVLPLATWDALGSTRRPREQGSAS